MRRSLVTGIAVFTAMVLTTGFSLGSQRALLSPQHEMAISFPTASGLVAGSDVLEAGAKIGTISEIVPTDGDRARVTIAVADEHWPLHQGVQASIRPKSLLGEKYVALQDGSSRTPYDGRLLVASNTSTPVELDQFINSLDPQTRASARALLDSLGAGVAGEGGDLNQAIHDGTADLDHLRTFGTTLNNRDPDLDRILLGLDGVLQRITTDDQLTQISQLISNGQTVLDAIETQRATFSRQFSDAQVTLGELNTVLDTSVPHLRSTLDVAPHLLTTLQAESDQLAIAASGFNDPVQMNALRNGILRGPTSSGGALETRSDGSQSSIFRICLILPTPGACTGNGTTPANTPTQAAPAADIGGESDAVTLAAFVGA